MMVFGSKKKRTLERYARDLPGLLSARYGSSATYTPGQVRRTVEIADFGEVHIEYACAMFLTKEDFDRLYTPGNYTFLRTDLLREIAEITGNDSIKAEDQGPAPRIGAMPSIVERIAASHMSDAPD